MKKETVAAKLAALLGIEETVVEKSGYVDPKKKKKNLNVAVGISEDEIQNFRAAQGLMYFLQAPELFTPKVCPHCGEGFLVSRQYVAFCSYTCIAKDLEAKGIRWTKGDDIEALVKSDVYEGNEPIWIRNLDRIQAVLDSLATTKASLLSQANSVSQDRSSEPAPTLSVPLTVT